MANIKRSSIVGFHNIKNKVSRNAFDLSHRHMFTAQIGELLPIFVQWCNPNETFKLGYNGFSRTQPLQTAAFTRLKENVQYYFVPFQSLWKYFEQQVTNMTTGQSGENISRIAASASEDTPITTGMPYVNYNWLNSMLSDLLLSETNAFISSWNAGKKTIQSIINDPSNSGYFVNGVLRSASIAKLLRALGYINTGLDTYDLVSSIVAYGDTLPTSSVMNLQGFVGSEFGFSSPRTAVENAPNLSIFPLLAYQKIINDHYKYRQWQPYRSYQCNIDYLLPTDSMNFSTKLGNTPWSSALFEMGQSNLPLDYFNGVLPKAQYGDESAASVDVGASFNFSGKTGNPVNADNDNPIIGSFVNRDTGRPLNSNVADSPIIKPYGATSLRTHPGQVEQRENIGVALPTHQHTLDASATMSGSGALKISALRSAIALQKYKEIQESNDSDFASQVLAHFGVKPKHDDYKSVFIGGGDSVIDINPQVNQNLTGDNNADIKATGAGQLSCGCKFTSDTFGIIIGIYRCVPQLDLAHVGIDRNLLKTDASDFPIPELDSIGMQTQYRFEVCAPRIVTSASDPLANKDFSIDMSKTYGYLPRYAELKTSYDRYEGAFLDSLRSWVTGYDSVALAKWMQKSSNQAVEPYRGIDALLVCPPSIVNSIFVDQTATTANNDKILVGSVNTCVAIRPFSVYGLPYSK